MNATDDFYGKVLDSLDEGVYFVDLNRTITYWNKGAESLTGYTAADMLGRSCADDLLAHVDNQGTALCLEGCPLQKTMTDGSACGADVFLRHRRGHRLPVSIRVIPVFDLNNQLKGAVEIFTDSTEKVAVMEKMAALQRDALLDPLTGLANRRYATDTLGNMLNQLHRYSWSFGLLFIDIDQFKAINDTYGHDVGDTVLKMVARTLDANSRSFDLVARWGGEEFLVIIVNVDEAKLYRVAYKLRTLVGKSSIHVGNESIGVTVSVGAALPRPEDTVDALVKRADQLMYKNKSARRNNTSNKLAV
jgi:diguanylate cyclase (GGDEF)-like protein/PAS domain S-box-containing protein